MNKKEKQQYIDIIKPMLTQKRFEHSLNVSEEAVKLAKKYGADTEKAELAGLLHDILKDTPPEKQLKILADFGIIMSTVFFAEILFCINGIFFFHNIIETLISHDNRVHDRERIIFKVVLLQDGETLSWYSLPAFTAP